MKFQLVYSSGDAVRQYRNLREWFADKNIVHNFEWTNTGNYTPDYVVIEDEQDATMFSLMMHHGEKTRL